MIPRDPFQFQLLATDGLARAGSLDTPHGVVETPVFMPVGTHSCVRSLSWEQVHTTHAQIVLSNAYHLALRPGYQLVAKAGGLHGWMNWQKPILTDSGGFQVFSLSKTRKIERHGVRFKDPTDGSVHFIGPKESMTIQNGLGADIIMAFDECPPYPVTEAQALASLETTQRWLEECFQHHQRAEDQALFPIIQGSTFLDLRSKSVAFSTQFPAKGFAIGGVSVGEPRDLINNIVRWTAPQLPAEKPRYLMGVGTIEDILNSIRSGIDMFDCVMPTRIARHGTFFTPTGRRIIRNAEFTEDFAPLVEGCDCYTCVHHHRAYIRHLFRQGESTAGSLMSIHNIHTLVQLASQARDAILKNTFEDFFHTKMEALQQNLPKKVNYHTSN
jgi:queuine tRNA-ribosyltransferase